MWGQKSGEHGAGSHLTNLVFSGNADGEDHVGNRPGISGNDGRARGAIGIVAVCGQTPAFDSTSTSSPGIINRRSAAGTSATRVSPEADSLGTNIFMPNALVRTEMARRKRSVYPDRGNPKKAGRDF